MELKEALKRSDKLRDVLDELAAAEKTERALYEAGGGDGYCKADKKVVKLRAERDAILKRLGVELTTRKEKRT